MIPNPFKNVSIDIKAVGIVAAMVAWCLSVAFLGVYGHGEVADRGMDALMIFGAFTLAGYKLK